MNIRMLHSKQSQETIHSKCLQFDIPRFNVAFIIQIRDCIMYISTLNQSVYFSEILIKQIEDKNKKYISILRLYKFVLNGIRLSDHCCFCLHLYQLISNGIRVSDHRCFCLDIQCKFICSMVYSLCLDFIVEDVGECVWIHIYQISMVSLCQSPYIIIEINL